MKAFHVPEGLHIWGRSISPSTLQQKASNLSEIPQVERKAGDHYPIFTTNEASPTFTLDNNSSEKDFHPNGYIIGVGAGNIFRMLSLYDEGTMPRGIVSADVIPEVVLAGRVITRLIKECRTKDAFLVALQHVNTGTLQNIIAEESSPVIRKKLEGGLENTLLSLSLINEINDSTIDEMRTVAKGHIPGGELSKTLIEDIFAKYDLLHKLATRDKIAFILQDITSNGFSNLVTSLRGYARVRNVIYLSNAVDHITNRGRSLENFSKLTVAQDRLSKRPNQNLYVFISGRAKTRHHGILELRKTTHPPTQEDYFH